MARCITEGGCFLPNTPIATPTGLTPIQNITIGTLVNTYDETTQQNTTKPVTNIFTKTTNKIYDIIVGKDTLHATPEHPFYTNGKWTIAQNLRKGMQLLTLAGALLPISQINAHDTLATVHNFEVQDAHTYYVGKQQVLVHNLCPGAITSLQEAGFSVSQIDRIALWGDDIAAELIEDIDKISDFIKVNKANPDDVIDAWKILRADSKKRIDPDILKRVIKDGGKVTVIFEQSAASIRQKLSVTFEQIEAKALKDPGGAFELKSAKMLQNDGVVLTDVSHQIEGDIVKPVNNGNKIAGDRDFATPSVLVEAKTNLNNRSSDEIITQLGKMIGDPNEAKSVLKQFVNPQSKRVVLYSGTPLENVPSVNRIKAYVNANSDKIKIIDNYNALLLDLR